MARRLRLLLVGIVVLVVIPAAFFTWRHTMEGRMLDLPVTHAAALLEERPPSWVVALGFVEPVTKELRLGFDESGVIEELLVKEGDMVPAGRPLARLRQAEQMSRLEEAKASMLLAKADFDMHIAGSRQAEREQADANLKRTQTWLDQSEREAERREVMVRSRSIGREELERATRDWRVAQLEHDVAVQEHVLVHDKYRIEEIEMSRQRLATAEARVRQAEAELDKTIIKAPVAGRILRIFSDPGEAYSILTPSPILSMGDTDVLNVRVEVDERDVARVKPGQKAFVAADAFGRTKFPGKVSRLELSMTPKRTRSGDPSEPIDRSVLEVLVTLDAPGPFYSGMRVDAYIEADPPPAVSSNRSTRAEAPAELEKGRTVSAPPAAPAAPAEPAGSGSTVKALPTPAGGQGFEKEPVGPAEKPSTKP